MSRVLMTANLYLACSKECDPQMVDRLKAAIDTLQEKGTVDKIEAGYLKGLPEW
jgi:polar amino acid transport system substrate-binding protein